LLKWKRANPQGFARFCKVHRLGALQRSLNHIAIEMGLRKIEVGSGNVEGQPAQPIGLILEQVVEPLDRLFRHAGRT